MQAIFIYLRTLLSYFLAAIVSLLIIPPLIFLLLLPKKLRPEKLIFRLLYFFHKAIVYCFLMPIEIIGKENLLKSNVIFVANHQSALDIAFMGMLCGGKKHMWFVLEELKSRVILGFFIKRLFITVNRDNEIKAAKSLIKAIKIIKEEPQDFIIFPEGGRYTDGKIHPFFKGFAILVKKTSYPVIPVYMQNNYKIYPPYTFLIYYNKIKAVIGKPMYIGAQESASGFCHRVRAWFEEQVG